MANVIIRLICHALKVNKENSLVIVIAFGSAQSDHINRVPLYIWMWMFPVVVEEGEVEEGELDEIGHLYLTREPEINLDNIEEIAIATTSGQESIGWRKLARAITPRRLLSRCQFHQHF